MASMDLFNEVTTLGTSAVEVGKITKWGNSGYKWIIEDIFSILTQSKQSMKSPHVTHSDTVQFYLKLVFYRYVQLSFWSPSETRFSISLGMETGLNGNLETHSGEKNRSGIFQVRGWMTYDEFTLRRAEILENGSLFIYCTLRMLDTDEATASVVPTPLSGAEHNEDENAELNKEDLDEEKVAIQQWKTVKKMQEDMGNLLSKAAEDGDVTLKVQDKEQDKDFPAHRIILGARSTVFKSMFDHETMKSTEVLSIECDPDIFPDFLTHVYTGSTRHLSAANVRSLYALADKYRMDSLKEDCVAFMKEHLSVDSFCDFIALALRHEEGGLLETATAFFRDHMPAIVKTPKWVKLLGENPTTANELLISATS